MLDKKESIRNEGIDVLRGLAVIAVILLHTNIRVPFSDTFVGRSLPVPIYNIIFWSGYYGVCAFFVISGFLITTSTFNKWKQLPRLSLKGFYTMRFARIMPLLLALLLVLSVLHLTGVKEFVINPKVTSLGRAVFAALTFHINWLEIQTNYLPGAWDVLWSLSIEEVFYLFFPVVCIFLRKEWYWIIIVIVFLIISPFARTVWFTGYAFPEPDHNHFAFLDAISLGCLAAIIAKRVEIKRPTLNILAILGWTLVFLITVFRGISRYLELGKTGLNVTILAIGVAMVLIRMQKRTVERQQVFSKYTNILRFFGRNSYEVYLTHMFVVIILTEIYWTLELSGEWAWALYIFVIFMSGILGELVAKKFSNPLNNMLRRRSKRLVPEVIKP